MLKSLSDMFATFLKLLETFPSSILPQKFKKKPKNALKNKPSMHSVEEIGFLDKSSGKERSKSFKRSCQQLFLNFQTFKTLRNEYYSKLKQDLNP